MIRVDRCPVDVFIASNMDYEFPFKLIKPEHASERVRESADCVIMDSGIGDDTTNAEVLDLAHELDTDFVVPCDELHDIDATVEAIESFMDEWESHECRATPLVALQPDHAECYRRLSFSPAHVMLGGMAFGWDAKEIINAVESFREEIGMGPTVHLLGAGASSRLVTWMGDNPGMVQSLDCSTPEQCAINQRMFDVTLRQREHRVITGEGSSHSRAGMAKEMAYTLCDAITESYRTQSIQSTL